MYLINLIPVQPPVRAAIIVACKPYVNKIIRFPLPIDTKRRRTKIEIPTPALTPRVDPNNPLLRLVKIFFLKSVNNQTDNI